MKKSCFSSKAMFAGSVFALATLSFMNVNGQAKADPIREKITPAFHYSLANVPGKAITALIVDYPPGGATPAHMHGTNFVVGYVLEGAIRSRLDNGQTIVYHAGQSWQEMPGAHHQISANDSSTQPAKLLALFIGDANDKDLVQLNASRK